MSDAYFDSPALGSTALACFRDSPLLFFGLHVAKTIKKEAAPALAVGSYLHSLLETHQLDHEPGIQSEPGFVLVAAGARRGTVWDAAVEKHGERSLILARERALALDLYRPLMSPRTPGEEACAEQIRSASGREIEHFWRHSTGLELRCKLDLAVNLDPVSGDAWFADIKTRKGLIPTAEEYGRSLASYGAPGLLQLSLYDLGFEDLTGAPAERIYHLVASKEPPHEWQRFEIDPEDIRLGKIQVERDLIQLAECFETGEWHRHEEEQPASLPNWWRRQYEEQTYG